MWSTELAWAAIGLARYTHYFSNSTVTYVLKDYGPNWTEVVTAVGSLLAGAGVIFVILGARSTLDQVKLAAQQVKEAEKVRLIALAIEMARRWDDDVIVAVRREIKPLSDQQFRQKYEHERDTNSDKYYEWLKLANFFEDFGALVKKDCLDIDLVDITIGNSVTFYWEKWSGPIIDERGEEDELYDNWEFLANAIIARQ